MHNLLSVVNRTSIELCYSTFYLKRDSVSLKIYLPSFAGQLLCQLDPGCCARPSCLCKPPRVLRNVIPPKWRIASLMPLNPKDTELRKPDKDLMAHLKNEPS